MRGYGEMVYLRFDRNLIYIKEYFWIERSPTAILYGGFLFLYIRGLKPAV